MSDNLRKVLHAFGALADLGEEMADTRDFEEMVRSALHVVFGTLGVRRGGVAEFRRKASRLDFVATRGMGNTLLSGLPLSEGDAETLRSERAGGIFLSASAYTDASRASGSPRLGDELRTMLAHLGVELVTPLVVRGDLVGALLLGGKASDKPFDEDDREVVRALARHIGIGLHNHRLLREVERRAEENQRLYDDLRTIYRDTVRAFAAAIDCKDKYTQGHSERVGKYCEIIAAEMGWSPEQVEGIAVAGYLHDIGKLVVDRDIINAPYKIDAKKSSELNRHPAAGYEILAPINHPYADIPLMARYHHERIDGRGYPEGLKGDEIPLGARIVSLADSFDAMTTDRPYKRRRAIEEVIEDFRRNTGKQFDAQVVIAFCRALLKEINGQTQPRKIIRLLGKDYIQPEQAAPLISQLISELEADACAVNA
ncbi:MAG TPA: HD domain-containing phosphohydrolase [Pyrinomonadaceae bacterium]|jgi:hypothetical protein